MFKFFIGFVCGGIFIFGVLRYHVLHAEDGFHLIPKMGATASEPYLDVREFTASDWADHPAVAAAVVRAGRADLMKDSAVDSLFDGAAGILKAMNN